MPRLCNKHIREAAELSDRLLELADIGVRDAEDDSCVVMYGIIRDCAYKLRQLARRERERHMMRGIWDTHSPTTPPK